MDDLLRLSERNWSNLLEMYEDVYRNSDGIIKRTSPLISYLSDVYRWPHFSLFTRDGSDLKEQVRLVNQSIENLEVSPFILVNPSEQNQEQIIGVFEEYGIRQIDQWPLIYYSLDKGILPYAKQTDFRLVVVEDGKSLNDWNDVARPVLFHCRAIPTSSLNSDKYILIVGYENDVPVATIMMYLGTQTSSAHIGCVLPEYRSKGYGKMIYLEALRMAADKGYSLSFGQSSQMGIKSWLKLGFNISGEINVFWKIGYKV